MDKQTWQNHITEIYGAKPPSQGGNVLDWKQTVLIHTNAQRDCAICKVRRQTRKQNERAKSIRQVYADCGLVRVKGALGGIYYE